MPRTTALSGKAVYGTHPDAAQAKYYPICTFNICVIFDSHIVSLGDTRVIEFLPLKTVVQRVGLSKSEIYRQIEAGKFPRSRAYKDNARKRFWLSTEVQNWQRDQVGDEFDVLLS